MKRAKCKLQPFLRSYWTCFHKDIYATQIIIILKVIFFSFFNLERKMYEEKRMTKSIGAKL